MNGLLNGFRIGLGTFILFAGTLIFSGTAVNPALAQSCDKGVGGKLGGAVVGGAVGSLFGKGKGTKATILGAAIVGGALASQRQERERARCLEEREAAKDRDMQRQLDYDRQRLLQEEQVRKEIEEKRLYDEWRKERLKSAS